MNRTDLQQLAELRVREARCLLDNSFYDGAYYLVGYAIECAFKAAVAKQIREHDFPDKRLANAVFTHQIVDLLKLSGLGQAHEQEIETDKQFDVHWALIVGDWSEQNRYRLNVSERKARDLFSAVTDPEHGVFTWLKKLW